MTRDMQAVRDDLAFMKAMAQEGRRAPLLSGRFLLSAGLVYGVTSLVAWAVSTQLNIPWRGWQVGLWIGVTAVYIPVMKFVRCGMVGKPGSTAVNNRAVSAVWQGLGYAILTMLAAVSVVAHVTRLTVVFAVFPSLILAVYGMAWWLAATMSDLKWIRWTSIACFASAILIGFMIDSSTIYLALAASFFLLVALPGWLLLRAEPSDIV